MNIVLKTRDGYINTDHGIKIVKSLKDATILEISKAFQKKEEIYKEKPMIGKISIEKC